MFAAKNKRTHTTFSHTTNNSSSMRPSSITTCPKQIHLNSEQSMQSLSSLQSNGSMVTSDATDCLVRLFPCLHPTNPHMRNIVTRLETFQNGWQKSRMKAQPKELAESGMYYTGRIYKRLYLKRSIT